MSDKDSSADDREPPDPKPVRWLTRPRSKARTGRSALPFDQPPRGHALFRLFRLVVVPVSEPFPRIESGR